MAFTAGDTINASHYNNRIGIPTGTPTNVNKALQPFISDAECAKNIAAIIGVGYGKYGYGQTSYYLPNVSIGDPIKGSEWTDMRNAIAKAGDHQGTSLTNLYPTSSVNVGDTVVAFDGGTNKELDNILTNVNTGAIGFLNDNGAAMSLLSNRLTMTRSTTWSGSINHGVRHQWSDANRARYFFNSGGEIRLNPKHPSTSGAQNADWDDILSNKLGRFNMGATSCSITGTASGIVASIGFYDLTTSYQTVFNGLNLGSGAYASNDVIIQARVGGTANNGGPGSRVDLHITMVDAHTGTSDTVAAGTNVIHDVYKATVDLVGIETPTTSSYNAL